jgi:hypothetical protein
VAVSYYLDASFLVALLTAESSSRRADQFVSSVTLPLLVSDFSAAEFSSAIARTVRNHEATVNEARMIFAAFDDWRGRRARPIAIRPADIELATAFMRGLDLPLKTPDAIHIAMTQRLGASLVTLDRSMTATARTLGVPVADL